MVEMHVAGIAIDATNQSPMVLLRDFSGHRQIPIWIDKAQAHNIISGIRESKTQTLLSHDLMMSLLKAGELKLHRIFIHSIEEQQFLAVLKIQKITSRKSQEESSLMEIEARPSDAIALAVRAKCGIWMHEEVLLEASIPVNPDADAEDQSKFRNFIQSVSPAAMVKHLKSNNPMSEGHCDQSDPD